MSNSNDFRLNSKFMFITWKWEYRQGEQFKLSHIFDVLKQKLVLKQNDNKNAVMKIEQVELLKPQCEYFILCSQEEEDSKEQYEENNNVTSLLLVHGFFYWSSRKSIKDCRRFFKVQGLESAIITCDKIRVCDPQNCINFIKSQKVKMEYGVTPSHEKSNKGGRPPQILRQSPPKSSKQLMEMTEEGIWCQKPSVTIQYGELKKKYEQFKALKDPEEKKEFQHEKLYEWQEQLLEELIYEKPPERLIIWYSDSIGNSGKSSFANYLADNYPSKCLLLDIARKSDMSCLAKPQHEWIIIDVCRAAYQKNNKDIKQLCMFIEKLKDARVMNSKYQSEMVKLNKTPHVIVMANFIPNLYILSKDRWNIRDLDLLNIPRKNEVESYKGALKFENLVTKQVTPIRMPTPQQQQQQQVAFATQQYQECCCSSKQLEKCDEELKQQILNSSNSNKAVSMDLEEGTKID